MAYRYCARPNCVLKHTSYDLNSNISSDTDPNGNALLNDIDNYSSGRTEIRERHIDGNRKLNFIMKNENVNRKSHIHNNRTNYDWDRRQCARQEFNSSFIDQTNILGIGIFVNIYVDFVTDEKNKTLVHFSRRFNHNKDINDETLKINE